MKKEIIALIFIFSISFSMAFDYEQLQGVEVPSQIQRFIGNQDVNVYIDNNFSFSVSISKGIISASEKELGKTSLDVFLSRETIDRIESSEDKPSEIIEAYKSGEIQIVRKTIRTRIVFWFARFFI